MNQEIGDSHTAADRLREQSTILTDDLRRLGHVTTDVAKEYLDQGRQKVGDMGKYMAGYVREKPVNCLAMAAGAGVLLGYLLGRRR